MNEFKKQIKKYNMRVVKVEWEYYKTFVGEDVFYGKRIKNSNSDYLNKIKEKLFAWYIFYSKCISYKELLYKRKLIFDIENMKVGM